MNGNRQSGLATVEFAIVAGVLLTVIIAVIDISRLYFSVASLNEATRRGARVAAVCPVGDPAIEQIAVFNVSGNAGSSPIVAGLQTQHIDVEYLNADGALVASPAGAGFENIRYVRVRINGGFQLQSFIPGFSQLIPVANFTATLPRESLGIPREGAVTPC
ncbi:MAG: TadE/TadG family type IV pilus assembly protein [Woeseiaceae bacterium]